MRGIGSRAYNGPAVFVSQIVCFFAKMGHQLSVGPIMRKPKIKDFTRLLTRIGGLKSGFRMRTQATPDRPSIAEHNGRKQPWNTVNSGQAGLKSPPLRSAPAL